MRKLIVVMLLIAVLQVTGCSSNNGSPAPKELVDNQKEYVGKEITVDGYVWREDAIPGVLFISSVIDGQRGLTIGKYTGDSEIMLGEYYEFTAIVKEKLQDIFPAFAGSDELVISGIKVIPLEVKTVTKKERPQLNKDDEIWALTVYPEFNKQ